MQNVQNAAEIQQRVINLVELYRRKVGYESQMAKDAKADNDYWEQESVDLMIEEGLSFGGGMYGEGPHTEDWIKHLQVNEQLLGHFYSEVAGKDAEKDVLAWLLPDIYDKTIFTDEEESFLKTHFKKMVNYIILTPCNDNLEWVHRHDGKDAFTIPSEVLELIKSRADIAAGSKVFYPNTCFAQLANLFEGCTFYCDTLSYAWTKIAVYANGIKAVDDEKPSSFDAIISYLPKDSDNSKDVNRICEAYKKLPVGGKLVLLCPPSVLVEEKDSSYRKKLSETLEYRELESVRKKLDEENASLDANARFRKMLVEDKSIHEIIQLPQVMSNNASFETYCVLIAEKGRTENDVLLVDARTASNDFDTKHYMLSFDYAKFNAIMHNGGIDPNTGLRKMVTVSADCMSPELLVPQVYTIERPSDAEHPAPLSNLCTLETTSVRDVQYDLPEDTPWITMSDLTSLFTGDTDMSTIRKADCPNNPAFVEGSKDYAFNKEGKFVDSIWVQMNTKKGHHVLEYRQCTFIDGNSDIVLYERSVEHGVRVAIVRSTGKSYAVSKGIIAFRPKDGIDVKTLAALLRLPIVYRQMIAYEQYGIGFHLDDILVPTDKRVVGDELYRMKREESVTNELGDKVQAMKSEYINEVRMRKHDMRPHMKQLNSAKNLMQHYVDNLDTTENVQEHLNHQLIRFRNALSHLSDIVDHLSDEEKFGEPERFSIIDYFERLISESINNNCDVAFNIDSDAVESYLKKKLYEYRDHIIASVNAKDQEFENGEYSFPMHWSYALIAPLDFERMVQNVLENARKHGFTDKSRSDYMIWINLSVDEKRDMYIIDFMNNGTPLPKGMTKTRYGIKGEKAGMTGGSGSGGYIVKSIITHYGGDYDIFCKDGITTIRLFLPIATV